VSGWGPHPDALTTQVERSQGRRWSSTPLRGSHRSSLRWGPRYGFRGAPARVGPPSRPEARPASDALPEPGAARPRPPRSGSVAEPRDALTGAALDPAPHAGGVGAEALGDGGGRVALEGPQDHDRAQGEAEEGWEPGVVVDSGRCQDVSWVQASDGLVVGVLIATRLLRLVAAPLPGGCPGP